MFIYLSILYITIHTHHTHSITSQLNPALPHQGIVCRWALATSLSGGRLAEPLREAVASHVLRQATAKKGGVKQKRMGTLGFMGFDGILWDLNRWDLKGQKLFGVFFFFFNRKTGVQNR